MGAQASPTKLGLENIEKCNIGAVHILNLDIVKECNGEKHQVSSSWYDGTKSTSAAVKKTNIQIPFYSWLM